MLKTFILILTVFPESSQTGAAIDHIEFPSAKTCEYARNEWLKSIPTRERDGKHYYQTGGYIRAICVPKE